MTGPYVVILTGGYTPPVRGGTESETQFALRAAAAPDPALLDLAAAQEAFTSVAADQGIQGALAVALDRAWRSGWQAGAAHHRVVQTWVLDDQATAQRFARFVTAEIDPAYVTRAADPAAELLNARDANRRTTS